ncbi:MAG: DUF192 domain-containing protein [Candidatus Omnitrophica bacterium]|nr:DUF192 domain-containing protein [Candidatus Omnitrophota bacterium]MBI3020786.1 DUF192 domain-containing protein [Candidatus Omnitrophota bacterium]
MAVIRNLTRQTVVAERAAIATGLIRRMVGLLSRSHLDEGEALIFPRCSAIHTWFMRFPLDVVFLKTVQSSGFWVLGSGQLPPAPSPQPPATNVLCGVVVKVVEHLKPFRFAWAREADTVIELPAGTILRTSTHTRELLEIAEDSFDLRAKKI